MKQETFKLNSGTILITIYSKEDNKTPRIKKAVVDDLFRIAKIQNDIYWITGVTPIEGKTIADVLDEYTNQYGSYYKFIFLRAGELVSMEQNTGLLDDLNYAIESTIGYALEAYFYKILFTRKMSRSYAIRDICVYSNDTTEDWIKENMGEDGIIKSVMASGKIN